jgi:glycosyltransferase involved in cell wall biosynthesis
MKRAPSAVFLVHLIQDVPILRPLVFMASRDFGFETLLLVSTKFTARDTHGIWRNELDYISAQAGARLEFFDDDWEAHRFLIGTGLLFSASESHLPNHITTHNVFRHAPPTYLKVTLQHGFECVGFRHSAEHVRAHGETASFGADFLCAWFGSDRLKSMAPSQRPKVLITGPTSVLQQPVGSFERGPNAPGLVCENLHSVRFRPASFKSDFVGAFAEFAGLMAERNRKIVLRPHPGGQYSLKNKLILPGNVQIENAPAYRLDLRRFAYGISAPSSVLMDMLLAEIPTAVWRDPEGAMDADSYEGLTSVSSPGEWLEFARAAEADPEPFVSLQRRFLERQEMPLDPEEVFSRFAELFLASERMEIRPPAAVAERERILFVANSHIPTLQLSFEKPLASLIARGEFASRLLTEPELRRRSDDCAALVEWVENYLNGYNPSAIIFCRYSGPGYEPILEWARRERVPVIYHIDDDLLAVPTAIGDRKAAYHNAPERLATVTSLLNAADLIYASTERLKSRLLRDFPGRPIVAAKIYCSGSILREPHKGTECKVGYMASADHAHNLEMILPAIERLLETHPQVTFELFGSIPLPDRLQRFGDRIAAAPRIADYETFLDEFAKREWDIGLCPLVRIDFNQTKANTKWVEYTAAGTAVVASAGTVYDECCANGCGILADGVDEWFSALSLLVNDVDERIATAKRAQKKLEQEFDLARLREQVLNVIAKAHELVEVTGESHKNDNKEEMRVCQIP